MIYIIRIGTVRIFLFSVCLWLQCCAINDGH